MKNLTEQEKVMLNSCYGSTCTDRLLQYHLKEFLKYYDSHYKDESQYSAYMEVCTNDGFYRIRIDFERCDG